LLVLVHGVIVHVSGNMMYFLKAQNYKNFAKKNDLWREKSMANIARASIDLWQDFICHSI